MTGAPERPDITTEHLIYAYCRGIFPMAEDQNSDELFWVDPRHRGIIPLDQVHISRSLARRMRKADYTVHLDTAFSAVLTQCADRETTWISSEIIRLFTELHDMGMAHSLHIEQAGHIVGGIYGLAIGGAFFAESMFSRRTDGSKLALVHLCDHLRRCGYRLFDTQFITPHLETMGGIEITRARFHETLEHALAHTPKSIGSLDLARPQDVLQRNGHKS